MNDELLRIATFLRQVDAFCARMNAGLSAVAVVLAVAVLATGFVRQSEVQSNGMDHASSATDPMTTNEPPFLSGWTYNY